MTRKVLITCMLILLISLFVVSPVNAAKSYHAEYFDVQIDLQEGGSAIITETVKFTFEGDPFTFAFREISARETDGLTFLEASMDGVTLSKGTQAGHVELEEGDPLKVTWHFEPTSNTSHVFTVRYRADGIIRKDDGDMLIWRAIPEDHDYSIAQSTITLTYPSQATFVERPTLDWSADAAWEEDRIVLTASNIAEDEDLILTAQFTPDSLTQTAPRWQIRSEQTAAATARALPVGLVAGIATLLLGGLGVLTYIRANARDLNISPVISTPTHPADISPAVIGKLTGQQHNFMGAIFDLAQRGVLEVREEKGPWGTKNHVVVRKDHTVSLKPYEQGLMNALYTSGETRIKMGEIATRLATKNSLFSEPLEQELVQRGWLDLERKQRRKALLGTGVLVMLFALLVLVLSTVMGGMSLPENPGWLPAIVAVAGISAALFISSIPFLIYAASYSVLTPSGEEQSARWKGFAEYLKQVSKGQEPAIRPDYFERYLAYAAVFGLGTNWAKYFQQFDGVPLPVWFHATAGSQANFGAMVAVMSASDSAVAGTGAGAGAGASGGGSSGAG